MTPQTHIPNLYHLTYGPHKPVMQIEANQRVCVQVPDCDGLGPDGKQLAPERFEKNPHGPVMLGNPVAGPYYITGAEPGDSVTIHIDDIHIDRDFGRTGISARQIHIPPRRFRTEADQDGNVSVPCEIVHWQLDTTAGIARLTCRKSRKPYIEIPLAPFPGCVAVAPENGQFIHTLHVGPFGGNIDIPLLQVGTCIHLPVFARGALVFLGDLHAAQGHGEIIGGGIEVSGSITFHAEVHHGKTIPGPRLETTDAITAVGTADNLQDALETALARLTLWLVQDYGFDRWEALHLLSQTVTTGLGGFRSAFCSVKKTYL